MNIAMPVRTLLFATALSFIAPSCVSNKKFKSLNANYETSQSDLTKCRSDNSGLTVAKQTLENENGLLKKQAEELSSQATYLKTNNTQALQQLQDMSVISK